MAVRNVRFGLIPWSRNAQRQGMFREAALTLLQGPQFSSWEFCHIGRPHRIAALAIGTLKSSATDVLAEQVLHGLAALGADRGRGIFRHVAHADRGESTTELTVTGNCRGWAVMGGLIIGFVFKARQGDQGFKQASGA